jgi:DNA-binding MarR family transcriptional regulator
MSTAKPSRAARERQAWQEMRSLVLERYDRRRVAAEAFGLSYVRVKALVALRAAPRPMRELAATLGIDAPYTTVIIDDLEARGLVRRTPHPQDRRAKVVALTAEGRQAAQRADRVMTTPPAALRGLTESELDALHELLSRLLSD